MMVTLELWITIIAVRNPNDWRHLELNERETKKKKKKDEAGVISFLSRRIVGFLCLLA